MQYATPSCQLDASDSRHSVGKSPSTDVDVSTPSTLVHGIAQEIEYTASRWSAPRKWLKTVAWLIGSGLHAKANATTQRVADDLAARMDYTTGHARYCLLETAARLGIDKATVKRHVRYLRELGALVWVQHGTRTNVRPMRDLPGYAATATVYAAAIPASYDHAMGHTIIGTGYTARIVIDQRRHTPTPVDTAGNPPVDNPGSEGLAPPSLYLVEVEGQVQMGGGFNYTSRASRNGVSPTRPSTKTSSSNGTRRHALQVARDVLIARQVRPLVNWTQRENLRRLAFALRPLIDHGMDDAYSIAAYLNDLCTGLRWRPKAPANYIRTVLTHQAQAAQQASEAAARFELENPAEGAFRASHTQQQTLQAAIDEGLARLHRNATANGWDDLAKQAAAEMPSHTDADAAADMAAFLTGASA